MPLPSAHARVEAQQWRSQEQAHSLAERCCTGCHSPAGNRSAARRVSQPRPCSSWHGEHAFHRWVGGWAPPVDAKLQSLS